MTTTHLPADRLVHIGVVVRDARKSAQHYAKTFGLHTWNVTYHKGERLSKSAVRGFKAEQNFVVATATAETPIGPMTFRLIEPRDGWTTYHEFLFTCGEGIHHICTGVITPTKFEELIPWLETEHIDINEDVLVDNSWRYVTLATAKRLGGVQVQLLVTDQDTNFPPHDEVWDLKAETAEVEILKINNPRMHFGVVMHDLMARVQDWSRLFGVKKMDFLNWQTGAPFSLNNSENMGRPVNHAYFTSTLQLGPGLRFELIQPTFGPSHYKEQFLDVVGEGIHHIYLTHYTSPKACSDSLRNTAEKSIQVVMGGDVGEGFARFYYLDTKPRTGFITEITAAGPAYGTPGRIKPVLSINLETPEIS